MTSGGKSVPSIGNGLHGPQLPHAPAPSLVNVSMPSHLMGLLDCPQNGTIHLVTHSLGSLIGRHLRRALGSRVTRMTLIEPVIVSVLRERHGDAAHAEMEEQYQRFMSLSDDHEAAAAFFVNHWSGAGAWESMGERGRDHAASLVPKLRLEMVGRGPIRPRSHGSPNCRARRSSSLARRHAARRAPWPASYNPRLKPRLRSAWCRAHDPSHTSACHPRCPTHGEGRKQVRRSLRLSTTICAG
jgi:pimeloyl-ACP methyl ester carboxylesterase